MKTVCLQQATEDSKIAKLLHVYSESYNLALVRLLCFRILFFTFYVFLHALQIMITTWSLTRDLDTVVLKMRTNSYNIEGHWKYLKFLFQFWNAA